MRPIDADKLIEYFQERLYVPEGNDDTKERYAHMAYVRSLNAIKNAPTIEIPTRCVAQISIDSEEIIERIKEEYNIVDAWIPCSERLPGDGELVLANVIGLDSSHRIVITDRTPYWHERGRINAWMPLPEPYEEDEDAN